jgi:hypothetical protein
LKVAQNEAAGLVAAMQGAGIAVDTQDGSRHLARILPDDQPPGMLSLRALGGYDPRAVDIRNLCRSMDRGPFRRQPKRNRIREASTIGRVVASKLSAGDLAAEGDGVVCKTQG